ncbi:MAG: glutamate mutase L, partial [Candidatus Izimaplasma sp.]|nr:glutamate mutase L [Candidatus Izimaplasma bacterium]
MKPYLLVDFGSTYTKLTAVDLENNFIIGTSKATTTVDTNVLDGYDKAFERLLRNHPNIKESDISGFSACSSAAGGLKMAAIGLVEELTVEAAKRACLGAGAIVNLVFSHHMTKREVKKLKDADIDIILLAGGTNGGNSECIIHNARKLKEADIRVPIIVAGNKDANDDIEDIFENTKIEFYIVANVMPQLKKLNVKEAKEVITLLKYYKNDEAKGIKKAAEK